MYIVHAPTEISGQMGILCDGLRARGHFASGYNWFINYLEYGGKVITTDAYELLKHFPSLARRSDIIHFHNGNTFTPGFDDLPHLFSKGKKMVMQHWGNDVRSSSKTSQVNPYPLPPGYLTDVEIHKSLCILSKYISTAIVQDYELYIHVKDYYPDVFILPLACNLKSFSTVYPRETNLGPKIIHAPTNRAFKGSSYVEAAINNLKSKAKFVYQTVENMSHANAMEAYLAADIIIDQLLCGTYGMLSVEAMAMGKVVVAFIREDVRKHLPPELPIVNANPETLEDTLLSLVSNPRELTEIGRRSRAYVTKYHEIGVVAKQLDKIYQGVR